METRKVFGEREIHEGDRNRHWHCDADSAGDRDMDRGIDSDREHKQTLKTRKPFTRLWSRTFLPLGWAYGPLDESNSKSFCAEVAMPPSNQLGDTRAEACVCVCVCVCDVC